MGAGKKKCEKGFLKMNFQSVTYAYTRALILPGRKGCGTS